MTYQKSFRFPTILPWPTQNLSGFPLFCHDLSKIFPASHCFAMTYPKSFQLPTILTWPIEIFPAFHYFAMTYPKSFRVPTILPWPIKIFPGSHYFALTYSKSFPDIQVFIFLSYTNLKFSYRFLYVVNFTAKSKWRDSPSSKVFLQNSAKGQMSCILIFSLTGHFGLK